MSIACLNCFTNRLPALLGQSSFLLLKLKINRSAYPVSHVEDEPTELLTSMWSYMAKHVCSYLCVIYASASGEGEISLPHDKMNIIRSTLHVTFSRDAFSHYPTSFALSWSWCFCLLAFHCFLGQQPLLLARRTSLMDLPLEASRAELSAETLFELWDQFLPRMLCQLPHLLPAINFTGPTGQTTDQKSGKQLTVRAAPTQHVLSKDTLLAWSFWVAGPAWPNLWIFDQSPGSLIFHLRLLVWPPNHGSLGRCDMAPWTLNSSGDYKNSNEGEKNFIRASSEVAVSAEGKGRGCFASCRNKHSSYKGLPSRRGLVWVVTAISLRVNNSIYFYTISSQVKMLFFQRNPAFAAWSSPQSPRLTPNGNSISIVRAWHLEMVFLPQQVWLSED